jgi:hypothetical protein
MTRYLGLALLFLAFGCGGGNPADQTLPRETPKIVGAHLCSTYMSAETVTSKVSADDTCPKYRILIMPTKIQREIGCSEPPDVAFYPLTTLEDALAWLGNCQVGDNNSDIICKDATLIQAEQADCTDPALTE